MGKVKNRQEEHSSVRETEEAKSRETDTKPVWTIGSELTKVANTKVSRRTVMKGTATIAAAVGVSSIAGTAILRGRREQESSSTTTTSTFTPGVTAVATAPPSSVLQFPLSEPELLNTIQINLNGTPTDLQVQANWTLNQVLRETLGLTGTKLCCNDGCCGACTVLLNGTPVYSCSKLAVEADGQSVTTIEGVGTATNLHPVQQAFINYGAFCCGQCTPGMIMTSIALLNKIPSPTQAQVVKALCGNHCRCGSQMHIIQALTQGTVGATTLG